MDDDLKKDAPPTPRSAAPTRPEARGSAVGFYVLLGIAALVLLILALAPPRHSGTPPGAVSPDHLQPNVPSSALTPPAELPPSRSQPEPEPPTPVIVPAPPAPPVAASQNTPAGTTPAPPTDSLPPAASVPDGSGPTVTAPDDSPAAAPAAADPVPGSAPAPDLAPGGAAPDPSGGTTVPSAPAPAMTGSGQSRL